MKASYWLGLAFVGGGGLVSACGDGPVVSSTPGSGGTTSYAGSTSNMSGAANNGGMNNIPSGAGIGEGCSDTAECRPGLACNNNGVCEAGHSQMLGDACVISPECAEDLQCVGGSCVPAGTNGVGEKCTTDGDCMSDLRCAIVGFATQCVEAGTADVGDACASSLDCYVGLLCADGACAPSESGLPFGGTLWSGVDCAAADTSTPTKAYFEVPGAADADEADFFRLPFPNDVRIKKGKVDLSGFPTPGPALLGFDLVAEYVAAVEKHDTGFGGYGTTFFRFSGDLDLKSIQADGSVAFVDVTPDVPENGDSAGYGLYYSSGRTPYVCENWVVVRRPKGTPMLPGHTYAVYLTTKIKTGKGTAVGRPKNLVSLLSNTVPKDSKLAAAHPAYKPFRDYLAAQLIDSSTILNAAVFTIGPLQDPMKDVAAKVASLAAPTAKDWVKCDDGVDSPCPDATAGRACEAGPAEYDEYHALVSLPIFQSGTAPYLTPADGGGIVIKDTPSREDVCMSLTVPKGTAMPAEGWPLVVFAHGTGGSFRSHVRPEVAGVLASAGTPFAVLGIDQVVHGPRRNGSTESPDNLFFNFLNPEAARGNPIQGAADQLSLAKFASGLDVSASDSGGDAIKVNPAQIFFFGHSQGSTEGSLALPLSDIYKAAVLSGNGASLMDALLNKTSPVDIPSALPFALSDPTVTDTKHYHPVLSLLQQWIDPADPLNFARSVTREPIGSHPPKHLFQTFGLDDTYSPPSTMQTYALAGGIFEVRPELEDILLVQADAPLYSNVNGADGDFTLGLRQYQPAKGDDGHFVVFDVSGANDDMVHFFVTAVSGVPEIGQ